MATAHRRSRHDERGRLRLPAGQQRRLVVAVEMDLVGPVAELLTLQQVFLDARLARERDQGREEVETREDAVLDLAGGDVTRPAGDHRHPHAAFEDRPLASGEGRVATVGPGEVLGAVIGGEGNKTCLGCLRNSSSSGSCCGRGCGGRRIAGNSRMSITEQKGKLRFRKLQSMVRRCVHKSSKRAQPSTSDDAARRSWPDFRKLCPARVCSIFRLNTQAGPPLCTWCSEAKVIARCALTTPANAALAARRA